MKYFFSCSRRTAVFVVAASVSCSQGVVAQSGPAAESTNAIAAIAAIAALPSAPPVNGFTHHVETSVSLGVAANLFATRINDSGTNFTAQSIAPSAGLFTTFRQSFKPWLGYSVNFGFSRPTYRYVIDAPPYLAAKTSETLVPTNMFEVSVSYLAQKHLTDRLSAFAEVGAGTIGFEAINGAGYLQRYSNAFKPEGIAGFGVDYRLPYGLGLRAEYRGLFVQYPYPDYSDSLRLRTINSSPTLSVTYNFGKTSKR